MSSQPSHPVLSAHPLRQVLVTELARNKQHCKLYSIPLGRAAYQLDSAGVESCIADLRRHKLLQAGLLFASEVRPTLEDRNLTSKEWRQFRAEVGCQPLLLACVGCVTELEHLRRFELGNVTSDASLSDKEKAVQTRADEVVRALIWEAGARVNTPGVGPLCDTALHCAARGGAPLLLGALLRLDADFQCRNGDGSTPEVLARSAGHTTCEQVLQVAAMMDVEKQEALVLEIEDEQAKVMEQKSKSRDKRKRRKQHRKLEEARRRGESAEDSGYEESTGIGESGRSSGPESSAGIFKMRSSNLTSSRGISSADEEDTIGGPKVPYGKHGLFSKLDEDQFPDITAKDADLTDEWDETKWGVYNDWGEEWDLNDGNTSDSASSAPGDDDEEELCAEIAQLREEKSAQLQQLYNLATERDERTREIDLIERQALRLEERCRRLEEREHRIRAGDVSAVDDTIAETEVSAWWEERATDHLHSVWELEKAMIKQQQQQDKELLRLQKEVNSIQNKSEGMEPYWDHLFDAESANELLDQIAADKRFSRLCEELSHLVESLDISDELRGRLPLLVRRGWNNSSPQLPPFAQLIVTAQVHARLQRARREQEVELSEMVDFCNRQLAAKDDEVLAAVEQELIHRVLPEMANEYDMEGWERVSAMAAYTRRDLERMSIAARSSSVSAAAVRAGGGRTDVGGSYHYDAGRYQQLRR